MASFCRSALVSSSRNLVSKSKTVTQKSFNLKPTTTTSSSSSPFASFSQQSIPRASRVLSALGSVETMIPLHSAIASARLRSSIAADSSCWSMFSQDDTKLEKFVYSLQNGFDKDLQRLCDTALRSAGKSI